jgi:hypothetical protein
MAPRQFPPGRKGIFFAGLLVSFAGFICFLSVFFSLISRFSDMTHIESLARSLGPRAAVGMLLMIVGGLLTRTGRA